MANNQLHIMHGRLNPQEDMKDYGFKGPVLEGVTSLQSKYFSTITIRFESTEAMKKAQELTGWDVWDETRDILEVATYDDMLMITTPEGVQQYFGDWQLGNDWEQAA